MDFKPSHRIQAQLAAVPTADSLAHALPVPVFVAIKRFKRIRQFARCAFEGFYAQEADRKGNFIWTRDTASVTCQFPVTAKLQYAWIEIAGTAPEGSAVTVAINGETLVAEKRIKGRSTIVAKLPSPAVYHQLTLDIQSSTFRANVANADDGRELGVAIRAIVFGKRATKYRAGSHSDPSLYRKLSEVLPWNKRKRRRLAA